MKTKEKKGKSSVPLRNPRFDWTRKPLALSQSPLLCALLDLNCSLPWGRSAKPAPLLAIPTRRLPASTASLFILSTASSEATAEHHRSYYQTQPCRSYGLNWLEDHHEEEQKPQRRQTRGLFSDLAPDIANAFASAVDAIKMQPHGIRQKHKMKGSRIAEWQSRARQRSPFVGGTSHSSRRSGSTTLVAS